MNVKQMIQKSLKAQKLDGLCNLDGECGCMGDDLFACDCMHAGCIAGRKMFCHKCSELFGYFIVDPKQVKKKPTCPECGGELSLRKKRKKNKKG